MRSKSSAIALFATALYGVHPAIAETVNYIIQRGDIYSTLGVIAGLLIYIRWPHRRHQGLYLIPVALGLLSKPPALVFPAILFTYLLLFEDVRPVRALARCVPAFLLSLGLGALSSAMTVFGQSAPPEGQSGSTSSAPRRYSASCAASLSLTSFMVLNTSETCKSS